MLTGKDEMAKKQAVMVQDQDTITRQLSLGLEVFLDVNPHGTQAMRYRARLCGWTPQRFLIFEPANPEDFAQVRRAQPCAVRFFVDGDVWGFVSTVLDPGAASLHHLVQVQWPARANRVRMREHDRVQLNAPCQLHDGVIDGIPAILDDLSLGGCSIRTPHLFTINAQIRISFQLPGCGAVERQEIIIRNVRKGKDRALQYGCQFVQALNPGDIARYISSRESLHGDARPQILVLSPLAGEGAAVQAAIGASHFEVAIVRNLLELGFRIWTGQPAAIMVNYQQNQPSALEACAIIKASPGLATVPLVVYGGGAAFHEKAFAAGVDLCLDSLEDAGLIAAFLGGAGV